MFEITKEDLNNRPQPLCTRLPTHVAYHIGDAKGAKGKAFWTPIGKAWAHNDGNGFNLQINAMPLDGRIILRAVKDKREQ